MMVFCATRNGCVATAKLLADWWAKQSDTSRPWGGPRQNMRSLNDDLQSTSDNQFRS